jgi:hypothetical protein
MATTEYIPLSDPIYELLTKEILKTYPKACVLWIEKNVNPPLLAAYEQCKEEIRAKRDRVDERMLFHGTSEAAMQNIIVYGFDTRRNKTSAYGKGTYFARDAVYSRDYAPSSKDEISYMMYCRVAVCVCACYSSGQPIQTSIHDNSVNRMTDPSIFVTPYDHGAFPEYVIAFHRNAK